MTTRTSSFNTSRMMGFYRSALRRVKGLGIFYFILSFGFMPMQYLMTIGRFMENDRINRYFVGVSQTYAVFSAFFFPLIQLVTAFSLAIYLFSFIHSRQAVDMYHSMPVTRTEIYLGNLLTAMTVMLPVLLIDFGVIAIAGGMKFGASYALMAMEEMVYWAMISFAVYTITAFATVTVGTVLDSVIFSGALLGGFSVIYAMICMLLESFVYGYYSYQLPLEWLLRFSPVGAIAERIGRGSYSDAADIRSVNLIILLWFIIGIAAVVIGIKTYQRRKSEMAQTVGNMGPLQILVRTEGVLVGGIFLATFFCALFDATSTTAYVLSVFVSSMVVYAVMELILSRNVGRIIKNAGMAIVSSLCVTLFVFCLVNGCFGYEMRVPAVDQVEKLEISYNTNYDEYYGYHSNEEERYLGSSSIILKDSESIQDIVTLHKLTTEIYQSKKNSINPYTAWNDEDYVNAYIQISYTLKNGKRITRSYRQIPQEALHSILALEANDSILLEKSSLFNVPTADVRYITVRSVYQNSKTYSSVEPTSYEKLLSAMQKDVLSETSETLSNPATLKAVVTVEYTMPKVNTNSTSAERETYNTTADRSYYESGSNRSYRVMIYDYYHNTLAVLKELNLLEEVSTEAPEIVSAYIGFDYYRMRNGVINYSEMEDAEYFYRDLNEYGLEYGKYPAYKIEDPTSFVAEFSDVLCNRFVGLGGYLPVMMELSDGSYRSLLIPIASIPQDAMDQLEKNEDYRYLYEQIIRYR